MIQEHIVSSFLKTKETIIKHRANLDDIIESSSLVVFNTPVLPRIGT